MAINEFSSDKLPLPKFPPGNSDMDIQDRQDESGKPYPEYPVNPCLNRPVRP